MPKIVKALKIAIDLQSLLDKSAKDKKIELIKAFKGALGAITVFSDVFDLYLINPYSHVNTDDVLDWLKDADCQGTFRKIIPFDEQLKNFYLDNGISVTITSSRQIASATKDISNVYFLKKAHVKDDIDTQILKVVRWRDIIRDVTKFASTEINYDIRPDQVNMEQSDNKESESPIQP
jgi:hypothetical protein